MGRMRQRYFSSGTVTPAGSGTAVTLFCGLPSINRSEYTMYTSALRLTSTMRTTRTRLNRMDARSLKTSSCCGSLPLKWISPTWRQATEASALSSAMPMAPLMPPVLARDR